MKKYFQQDRTLQLFQYDVTVGLIVLEVNKNKHDSKIFSFQTFYEKYPFPAHYFLFPTMSTSANHPQTDRRDTHGDL